MVGVNVASNQVLISIVSTEALITKPSSETIICVVTCFLFQFSSVTVRVTIYIQGA
jgi:hypothetical protein